ncbi:MAG: acyl-CoA desaturase [Planctomycetota bacterium]|nr:acyl-CoA desaturase [Planctomycetota bacterium]
MQTTKAVFQRGASSAFVREVKDEVASYFRDRGISDKANAAMVAKTVLLLGVTFGAYGLLFTGWFSPLGMLGLAIVMGIGWAGIGFGIGHDAIHGAYSKHTWVNRLLGYSFELLGASSYMWRLTHNGIHHTWTNVRDIDEDLVVTPVLRLTPHSERRWFHRFQTLFALPAYATATLFWVFAKDYKYFFARQLGPHRDRRHPPSAWVGMVLGKVVHYGWTIVLPLLFLDLAWWQFVIGYLTVHLTAGLILGVIFMLAHVVEQVEYPEPDTEGQLPDAWMVHQLRTTADFARRNRLLGWYVGGLNFQVEHHLFPKVCSVHYHKISPIVEEVARKHGVPFNDNPTFLRALGSHFRMLHRLGRPAAA